MGVYDIEDWLENKGNIQEKEIIPYQMQCWRQLEANGATDYIGQVIDGIEITPSGLLAASMLGPQNVLDALESGDLFHGAAVDGSGTKRGSVGWYMDNLKGWDISYITGEQEETK